MKYRLSLSLLLTLLLVLTGCTQSQPPDREEKSESPLLSDVSFPIEFLFSSGVGAWGTSLTLQEDGSFTGVFHDTDMGDTGAEYPEGTVYICGFSGRFDDISRREDGSYSLTLHELTPDTEPGTQWIENQQLWVTSDPYGVEDGKEFILFLPGTPVSGLDEEFLSWWPGRWVWEEPPPDTLSGYGLWNVQTGHGFFS